MPAPRLRLGGGGPACQRAPSVGKKNWIDDGAVQTGGRGVGGRGEGAADGGGEAAEDLAGTPEADLGLGRGAR